MSELPSQRARVVLFAHNRNDTGIVKRIAALLEAGADLTTFMFRRDGALFSPNERWSDIDLGHVAHQQFGKRLSLYARTLKPLWSNRKQIRTAHVIHARNLDTFLLAWITSSLMRFPWLQPRPRYVYETIDIHLALVHDTLTARVLRWIERRVLQRCDLLIVTSPGFLEHYYKPVQGYYGPHLLIENKMVLADGPVALVDRPADLPDALIIIAWVGIIRCQQSLSILKQAAIESPEHLLIRISGLVSDFLIDDFAGQIADIPNIVFEGRYDWPDGLGHVYRGADYCWSQDLEEKGYNSDWLIPNRLYEASYFGVLSLAVEGTETAKIVKQRHLGYVLPDTQAGTLVALLQSLNSAEVAQRRAEMKQRPRSDFVYTTEDSQRLLAAVLGKPL